MTAPRLRFPGAAYGPTALRPLLRARLEPGEHLVGWAPCEQIPPPGLAAARAGLMLVPIVGQLVLSLEALAAQTRRRLMVLTTARLLLLRLDETGPMPGGFGVAMDCPLDALTVRVPPSRHPPKVFTIGAGAREPASYRLLGRVDDSAPGRLREGLVAIAEEPGSAP